MPLALSAARRAATPPAAPHPNPPPPPLNPQALDLWIVSPRCDPTSGEVEKVACGAQVTERMRVVGSLEEALGDTVGEWVLWVSCLGR